MRASPLKHDCKHSLKLHTLSQSGKYIICLASGCGCGFERSISARKVTAKRKGRGK